MILEYWRFWNLGSFGGVGRPTRQNRFEPSLQFLGGGKLVNEIFYELNNYNGFLAEESEKYKQSQEVNSTTIVVIRKKANSSLVYLSLLCTREEGKTTNILSLHLERV